MRRSELDTTPERSALMKRVRQSGTSAELVVRAVLTHIGARYRLNVRGLPGRPDVANGRLQKALFVHGCFWHFHRGCSRGRIPSRNHAFWSDKLERNADRDRRKIDALHVLGYEVLVVWECELKDYDALVGRLKEFWFGSHTDGDSE
jgi:DNA mismatch endonuclease, patch repair protein